MLMLANSTVIVIMQSMTNSAESNPTTEPFDIDGFIGALEFFEDNDTLYDYMYSGVKEDHPEAVISLYEKMAVHENPRFRKAAAVGIDIVFEQDEETAIGLWKKLIVDEDKEVNNAAIESMEALPDRKPELGMDMIIRLGKVAKTALEHLDDTNHASVAK